MTDQLMESLKDTLTVLKLSEEVKLAEEQREEIRRVCNIYLGSLLNHKESGWKSPW